MHDILRRVASGSVRQIDPDLAARLLGFADAGFGADDLKGAIDEAVRLDLADAFIVHLLRAIWEWKMRQEGRPV